MPAASPAHRNAATGMLPPRPRRYSRECRGTTRGQSSTRLPRSPRSQLQKRAGSRERSLQCMHCFRFDDALLIGLIAIPRHHERRRRDDASEGCKRERVLQPNGIGELVLIRGRVRRRGSSWACPFDPERNVACVGSGRRIQNVMPHALSFDGSASISSRRSAGSRGCPPPSMPRWLLAPMGHANGLSRS